MIRWCTVTIASIFAQRSVKWEKYQYVASECALKSWNAPKLAPVQVCLESSVQRSNHDEFRELKFKLQQKVAIF